MPFTEESSISSSDEFKGDFVTTAAVPIAPDRVPLEMVASRYYGLLTSFFRRRVKNRADVEDLVQQVFLRLSQRPVSFTVQNFDAYILRTASNAWTDYWRRGVAQDRYIAREDIPAEQLDACRTAFSSERVLLGEEAAQIFAAALNELPKRTREVFVLRCMDGRRHAEVAKLVGITPRAVQKQVAKALQHLGKSLE